MAFIFLAPANAEAQRRRKKQAQETPAALSLRMLQQHVAVLAHDSLEGRRTGTPGEQKAIHYITGYYRQAGIAPAGNEGTYLQPFFIDEGKHYKGSSLRINGVALQAEKEYFPLAWSAAGSIRTDAHVSLHEAGTAWWIDVHPHVQQAAGNPHFVLSAYLYDVAKKAAEEGATTLLFYNSGLPKDDLAFQPKDRTPLLPIPAVYVAPDAVKKLRITEESAPEVEGTIVWTPVGRQGTNVLAKIEHGAPYTIVLGAHFDHIGYGEDQNSRHTGAPAIHNGADDNASGTAALLELGRRLATSGHKGFNYLLAHFSGEELGLYGSKHLTENPVLDLNKVSYMINMDMVGRLNDSSKALTVGGIGTSPDWGSLVQPGAAFTFKIDSSGTGPSDHTSFYRKDIPVLFFFTGLHTDYHTPEDDAEKLNYEGMRAIVDYIEALVLRSPTDRKLAFSKTREQSMGGRGFKVSIGIMPDYTYSGTGVKADGVIEGRPAQKAGLQANDIILQLGEHLITGVDTYMMSLNKFEKGESTTITIKRGNAILTLPITF